MTITMPGLTPQGDRPRVGTANRGRVQAPTGNDIRAPGLNPTARPVDTYARPQAPAESDLRQFTEALASFSPSLGNLMANEAAAAQKHAAGKAARLLGGMTYEQHRDFLERGGPELQDPWFKAAAMRMFGERQAIYRTNQLAQEYATSFDKQNGNIDEFVSTAIAEDLEQWGDDEYFMGAYGPLMQDYRGKQTAQHTADLSTMMVDDAKAGVYDTFYGTAERMLAENKSPEEIVAALRGRYESNNGLLNVSFKDQDEEWMRVAKTYAEKGNLDMVKAMLESDRTGPDGIAIGPIASQREFAADAANTLETATRVAGKQAQDASLAARQKFDEDADLGRLNEEELISFYNQNPGAVEMSYVLGRINQNRSVVAQAQQKAATAADKVRLENQSVMDQLNLRNDNLQLVDSNRVPFIQDAQVRDDKGEPKTITADQQRKWLAEDIQQQVQVIKDREGLTDVQAFDVEAAQFTMAGILNPTWESVLAAGPVAANAWSLSGEPPPSLVSGAELYMQLHAKSPVLLERHLLDAETKRFYETYRTAVEYGKMEPSQAYSHAANIVRNPPIDNPLTKLPKDDLKGIVRSIGDGKSWFGGGTANNEAYVSEWINLRAKEYGLMGTVTGVQAGEEAKKDFLTTHTAINGQWVETRGRFMPANFEAMVKTVIEDYARDFPEEDGGLSPEDLTIQPATNGTGAWMIVHKGGYPIAVEDPSRRYVTLQSMQEAMDARAVIKQEELSAAQAKQQDEAVSKRRDELTSKIKAEENWLSTPSYQRATATQEGQEGLDARLKAAPTNITTWKKELEELENGNALRVLEQSTKDRDGPILDLLKF